MTDLVDRSGPGVRITVLSNERAPSGEPLNLDGRILGFTYEDAERKADQVSIQLDNFDLALFDREELTGGATLEVSWGYPGSMAPPRRVVVKRLKGFQTLTDHRRPGDQRAHEPRGQDARVDEQVSQRRRQGDRRRARLRRRVYRRRGHQ